MNRIDLNGRVAVVAGGAQGIGSAIAGGGSIPISRRSTAVDSYPSGPQAPATIRY